MLKAIFFVILAIAYASLVDYFEPRIMEILGTSKVASYVYVYGIFLTPMITLLAFSVKAYQSSVARKMKGRGSA
jgi:hypothetical protein